MRYMAKLTVVQAAQVGWASRQTIYRKARSGTLSPETDANGTTVIDTSELVRVFGEPASRDTAPDTLQSDSGLQVQIDLLQAELARAREDLASERQHRDRLTGLLERQLTDQRPWWSRLVARS